MSIISIFIAGGPFMWPILILSIAAVAIILERIIQLVFFQKKTNLLLSFLEKKSENSGFEFIDSSVFGLDKNDFNRIMEDELQLVFDKFMKNIELLSAVSAIAPLLGFIGTVSGMIGSFQTIAKLDKISINHVAGGISEALITTGFGLIVAVICMSAERVFSFYFRNRAHKIEERVSNTIRKNYPDEN
jgi:biopolymer transport protein ExbB